MTQRLELVWPGKDKFLLVPKDESGKPVWVDRDHPAAREVRLTNFTQAHGEVSDDDPCSDNLLFTGDSLDVLRALRDVPEFARQYRGKVKLCYIDVPFNTGQTFTHYDDWMEHSTWLSFMRDRLLLVKDLLSADGSVWVHLDDAEVHRMRCLMDEVFGASNFVATVVWEKVYAPRNDAKQFSTSQDMILIYSKSAGWVPNRHRRLDSHNEMYKNPDNDPNGPWTSGDYTTNKTKEERPNLWYPITRPADGAVIWPAAHLTWRFSQDKHAENVETGSVWWGKDGLNATPRFKRRLDAVPDIVPTTLWKHDEVGHTDAAKKEIKALFPSSSALFSTPKPERLLERVIHIGSQQGDVILDCFGGSGTTAAVAHKMGRRWITAEVLSETVDAVTSVRLSKVVDGEDMGGITVAANWKGGGGFRQVAVAPSMYEITSLGVMLADWATGIPFERAVAGQLGFEWQSEQSAPFCGKRGRMRLCVFDGAIGVEEARVVIAALDERERVTIVAKVLLPGVEEFVAEHSKGSRVKKAPRDLLTSGRRKARRHAEGTT